MKDTRLRNLTLTEAGKRIQEKKISPLELTKCYLEQIQDTEDTFNSFTEVYFDEALIVAKAMEDLQMAGYFLGPLHGIPVAVKDNIEMKGKKTTAASKVWRDHISKEDAAVITKLKKSGAVILGKTNLHEFASGATTDSPLFGAAHNPWNPERFCCGSSGGSAASIANGTSLGTLGTDTGGSVRLPSAVCGVVGMRPTYGKVSIKGIAPLSYSLDACGPITRNVMDNAVMLNVIAGRETSDPSFGKEKVTNHMKSLGEDLKKIRIGILPEVLFKSDQPDVISAVEKAMDIFRSLGAEIVECQIENLDLMVKAWYTVDVIESSAYHQRHTREQIQDFGEDVRAMLLAGEMLSGVDYVQAQRYRRWLRQEFDEQFHKVDMFLFPTLPVTAVKIGNYIMDINGRDVDILPLTCTYVCFAPATGLPALSLPCGRDHDGMPVGMMLLGSAFHEDVLYQAGYAFEQVYSLYKELPGLKK